MTNSRALSLSLLAGLALSSSALAQPAATNLGTLTLGTPVNASVPQLGLGEVAWFKFTLSQPVAFSALRFLDVTTTAGTGSGGVADNEIALFNSAGTRISSDDDDGLSTTAFLTFGTGSGILPSGSTPTVGNGRDGDLPAGTYYLGVAYSGVLWQTSNWGFTFSNTLVLYAHNVTINAANTAVTAPAAGAFDLGTLPASGSVTRSDPLVAGQTRWYKAEFPAADTVQRSWLDIDTEGSSLSLLNRTRISLFGPNGAVVGNSFFSAISDANDGSGDLSQLTFGLTTPVRPAPGDGLAYNGRDGALRAGTYYIAVSTTPTNTPSNSTSFSANFGTVSTGTNAGTINLNINTGFEVSNPTVTLALSAISAEPGGSFNAFATVTPGFNPVSTGIVVTLDTAGVGAGTLNMLDNGVAPDVTAGDGIFSVAVTVPPGTPSANTTLIASASDEQSRTGTANANFVVVGPVPPCPTGPETHSLTNLTSDGTLNTAGNGIATFNATSSASINVVRMSGRFIPGNAFSSNARLVLTSPGGQTFTLTPFLANTPSGVPADIGTLEAQLACAGSSGVGEWTVRAYETIDDAGVDGVWTNLCFALDSQPPTATGWSEDACGNDAGELPAAAQSPVGTGALTEINGLIASSGDTDMYRIAICDVASFSVTTDALTTGDTQLFLFNLDGTGIMHNDDRVTGDVQSDLNNLGGLITAPGDYYLAISGYNRDPQSVGSLIWANTPFVGLRSPDGPGATGVVDGWTGSGGTYAYGIALTGVCYPGSGGGGGCNLADITDIGDTGAGPDDQLTVDDLIGFVNSFGEATGCPGTPGTACNRSDVTDIGSTGAGPDGQLTVDDIIAFVNAFGEGCPA